MTLYEKIQGMTPEEFVDAACLGMACLLGGCDSKGKFEMARPVIDGITQMLKEGFTELLTEMPWEQAAWELLESMSGKG